MNQGLLSLNTNSPFNKASSKQPIFVTMVTTSQTWVCPITGYLEILAFGAGGSGGLVRTSAGFPQDVRAQGGCSGGTSFKKVYVKAGDVFSFTIGAGGIGKSIIGGSSGNQSGANGGTTSIVGPNCNIVIPGGLGGQTLINSTSVLPKLARSSPSGGDINIAGGVSGSITVTNTSAYGKATGGAGPCVFTTENDSGSINITTNLNGAACTGGSGMRPSGSTTSEFVTYTGGGGAFSEGITNSSTRGQGYPGLSDNDLIYPLNFFYGILSIVGSGTDGGFSGSSAVNLMGGGSGAAKADNAGTGFNTGGAILGGSGGLAIGECVINATWTTGTVTYCGGSGGMAASFGNGNIYTGAGGQALVLIAAFQGS